MRILPVDAAARAWAESLEPRLLLAATLPSFERIATGRVPAPRLVSLVTAADPHAAHAMRARPKDKPLKAALKYLADHAGDFGITAARSAKPVVTGFYTDADTGVTHISLRARGKGRGDANANLSISLTRDNQVITAATVLAAADSQTVPFPAPLAAKGPAGTGVYEGSTAGSIGTASETDAFTINLDAGETLTAVADPGTGAAATLQPTLEVRGPDAAVVATAASAGAGKDALIQSAQVAVAGAYTVTVGSAGGTVGPYTLGLTLGAATEAEQHDGSTNDTIATAQNIDSAFTSIGDGSARAAVVGSSNSPDPGQSLPFQADFETDNGGFVVNNGTTGLWHVSTGRGGQSGHSGTHSFYYGKNEGPSGGGTYDTGAANAGTITSPSIALPAVGPIGLDFNYVLKTEGSTNWDLAQLQVSTDGGTTFTTLAFYNGVAESTAWRAATQINLTPYAGKTVKLRWSFDTRDGSSNGFEGWYIDDVRVQAVGPSTDDYAFTLSAGQSATIALKAIAGGPLSLSLYDPGGTLQALGGTGASNADQTINDFVAPAAGTYYVSVTGVSGSDYSLAVTRNAEFDTEDNGITTSAELLQAPAGVGGVQRAVGAITAGDVDLYKVTLAAGSTLIATTATPGDGAGEPVNALDPRLRLLDASGSQVVLDDNSGPDGRNAQLSYSAPSAGTYYVEVSAATSSSTVGDYVLSVSGASVAPAPFQVTSTSPASGASFKTATPSQITITFNDSIILSTLQPSSLTLDGVPATSVSTTSANTAVFQVPSVTATGVHTFAIAAGAVSDLQGTPVTAFSGTFTIDATPPRVIASSVAEGDILAAGPLTYTVTFNEPMLAANLDRFDFSLDGLFKSTTFFPASFSYDATKTVLTINYTSLPEDNYRLTLFSGNNQFEDAAGNDLDGEPAWPLPAAGSGNGIEGGNFVVNFGEDSAGTIAFPGSALGLSPAGGSIYTRTTTGVLNSAADSDSFTLALDAPQTVAIAAGGGGASSPLRPVVELLEPAGTVVTSASATAAGQEALVQAFVLPAAGTYTIRVSNAAAGTAAGPFNLQVWENAAVEAEAHGGASDDTRATAQSLDAAFIPLDPAGAVKRTGVAGTLPAGAPANDDWYSFTANAGEPLSLAVGQLSGGGETLALFDSAGNLLASGTGGASNSAGWISNVVAPAAATYYARVSGAAATTYQLVVVRSAAFEVEPNDTPVAAQGIDPAGAVLGSTISNDDYYRFPAAADSTVTLRTYTPGDGPGDIPNTLVPRIDLFDPNNTLLASNHGGAPDGRNALLTYQLPASGIYRVRVNGFTGSGDYLLTTSGATPLPIPGTPDLLDATDSGVSATDNLTNFNNVSPAGALQFSVPGTSAGATVTIYVGGVAIGSAVASGATTVVTTDGTTRLFDGTYNITARQTPPGQPESPDSVPVSVTIDTIAPSRPAPLDLEAASDSGVSNTDNTTNVKTPVFDVFAGPFFRVYRSTSKISGDFQTGATFQAPTLSDGATPFTVTAVDAAGNESAPSAALGVTIDTSGPAITGYVAPNVLAAGGTAYQFTATLVDGSGVDVSTLGGNDIVVTDSFGSSNLSVTLVSVDDGSNGTPRTAIYQVTPPGGSWDTGDSRKYNLFPQAANVKDVAGNPMSFPLNGSFYVGILGAPALTFTTDTGASTSDGITFYNNSGPSLRPEFGVTGAVPGATVTLYADGVPFGSAVVSAAATTVSGDGVTPLSDGPHIITLRQTSDGVQSPASPGTTVTFDSQAPTATLGATSDVVTAGGTSYTFSVTYTDNIAINALTLTAAGPDVLVTGPNGFNAVPIVVSVDSTTNGTPRTVTYRITPPGGAWDDTDNGSYTITMRPFEVSDIAGLGVPAGNLGTFAVSAPVQPPGFPILSPASDSGQSSSDGVTNFNNAGPAKALSFTVSNTVRGATVTLYADGVAIGSAVAGGPNTQVTTNGTTVLADGVHLVSARQTPPGGAETPDSAAVTQITVDTVSPATPGTPDLDPASDSGVSATDDLTNVTIPKLNVPVGEGGSLHFVVDGIETGWPVATTGGAGPQPVTLSPQPYSMFQASNYSVGNANPVGLAAADFTGDGALDLAVACDQGGSVLLPGNGTGGFLPAQPLGPTAENIAEGDFNLDGKPDVVLVGGGVLPFINIGSGGFTPGPFVSSGNEQTSGVVVADFNGDRAPDVAIGVVNTDIAVFLNNGDGTFQPQRRIGAPVRGLELDAADVNGDGIPDLIGVNTSQVSVSIGNGDGTFKPAATFSAGVSSGVVGVAAGDFNRDGKVDVLTGNGPNGNVSVLQGHGDGTFGSPGVFAVNQYANQVHAADLNRDGKLDAVAAAINGGNYLAVLLGNGNNTFQPVQTTPTGLDPLGFAFVDVNADGRLDAAVANFNGKSVSILRGQGGALSEGGHSIAAWAEDLAGNRSATGLALNVTIDTTAPAAPPAALDLQAASDTGASNTDNVTKVNTPVFDVTPGPGGTYYRVFRGGTLVSGSYETSTAFTSAALADGTYSFTARAVDAAGNLSPAGPALSVVIDTAAPNVSASAFQAGSAGHAVSFTFNKDVGSGSGLTTSALRLVNLTTGQSVEPSAMSLSYDPATKTGTWTFPGLASTGGRLADGNYQATLAASAILSLAGVPMAADYTFNFFVLNGDITPQRPVFGGPPAGNPKSGGTSGAA